MPDFASALRTFLSRASFGGSHPSFAQRLERYEQQLTARTLFLLIFTGLNFFTSPLLSSSQPITPTLKHPHLLSPKPPQSSLKYRTTSYSKQTCLPTLQTLASLPACPFKAGFLSRVKIWRRKYLLSRDIGSWQLTDTRPFIQIHHLPHRLRSHRPARHLSLGSPSLPLLDSPSTHHLHLCSSRCFRDSSHPGERQLQHRPLRRRTGESFVVRSPSQRRIKLISSLSSRRFSSSLASFFSASPSSASCATTSTVTLSRAPTARTSSQTSSVSSTLL